MNQVQTSSVFPQSRLPRPFPPAPVAVGAAAAAVSAPSEGASRRRAIGLGTWLMAMVAAASVIAWTRVGNAAALPPSLADLAAKVSPAVVTITASHAVSVAEGGDNSFDFPFMAPPGSPFDQFLKQFREHALPHVTGRETALGSGFIIDPSGYIVTNNHVIAKATNIQVKLSGGGTYHAHLVGADQKTDLALLKIDAGKPLPHVEWGNSDKIRVGDWVMAVGNPFGLGGTVTAGIVSARGRDINAGPFDDFIQIDASINKGNSGGPTFAMDGKVIGINTAIYSPNGGSVGIGFAIPSDIAQPVIAQLKAHGHVDRGWLGVTVQTVTPSMAQALGLDKAQGALVASVESGSPAAQAHIRQGDVIVKVDGKAVDKMRQLPFLVAALKPGSEADVTVLRDGRSRDFQVHLGTLPAHLTPVSAESSDQAAGRTKVLGASLAELDSQLRDEFNLPDSTHGVVVVGVDGAGPAGDQGLRPGDVIRQAGGVDVTRPEQVRHQVDLARHDGKKAVMFLIDRGGQSLFVAIPLAKG